MWGRPDLAEQARERARTDAGPYQVFPWHWRTVSTWCQVWRQWRYVAGGMAAPQRDGLDWAQVLAVLELGGVDRAEWPTVRDGLFVMQSAALEVWSK